MNSCYEELLKNLKYASHLTAQRIVDEYSKAEVVKRSHIRHISEFLTVEQQRKHLIKNIAEEIYILDVSKLTTADSKKIRKLAAKVHIKNIDEKDNVHLAWEIAMFIARDKLHYKFNKNRDIVLK